ncbi:hypothetical protein L596_003724 [Steinernema carpocapsae]|uniref:Uncharacterized protein n=1 Tax=Steinernema carpocapsae TaxID=34508 RepID=A0A4V6I843_STECR|nr:hypothetical protein L596_003724 [Steinernema carpocapsae]
MDETDTSPEDYRLLRRPNSLPDLSHIRPGLNARWTCKYFFYKHRSDIFPRTNANVHVQVLFSTLVITGFFPMQRLKIPLVTIGYIESEVNRKALDVRGVRFRLLMFGFDQLDQTRDRLRFLVVRQRVPHCILKLPFEWQTPAESEDEKVVGKRLLCCLCMKGFD